MNGLKADSILLNKSWEVETLFLDGIICHVSRGTVEAIEGGVVYACCQHYHGNMVLAPTMDINNPLVKLYIHGSLNKSPLVLRSPLRRTRKRRSKGTGSPLYFSIVIAVKR